MKKILFVAATLLALISTSCSNNGGIDVNDPKEYCWKITISASYMGMEQSSEVYVWADGEDVQEAIEAAKEELKVIEAVGGTGNVTAVKSNLSTEESCYQANEQ